MVCLVDGDDRGLVEHDAFAADVDQRVRGSKVDGEIVGEHSGQQVVEHHGSIPLRLNAPRRGLYISTVRATQKRNLHFSKALGRAPGGGGPVPGRTEKSRAFSAGSDRGHWAGREGGPFAPF